MGRNRGKAKKQPLVAAHEDHGSREEEKMSAKRRGRPLKISKSETKAKEEAKNFDDGENMNGDESDSEIKINGNDSVKPVGFRQNGSRRKNKPQRAAEVGVECR
ncbi:uncharacterized protein LOC141686380 [Apium graveolens]|uniref:uncharacterized protein LOC141686380 n=1 Tax=Apium graveolens TaxID=4045 RepID=UPI003D78EA67